MIARRAPARRARLALLALTAALAPALQAAPEPAATAAAAAASLEPLAFMAGCFRGEAGDGAILEERWSAPRDGMMLGTSQYTKEGRTLFFELSRVEGRDGKVTLWPQPGGKPTVGFTLARATAGEAVFENLSHDFPRRLVYKKSDQGLAIHLEGDEAGKAKSEDYAMTRIPCEAAR